MTPLQLAQAAREAVDLDMHEDAVHQLVQARARRAARARAILLRQGDAHLIRWALRGYDPEDAADAAEMERWR